MMLPPATADIWKLAGAALDHHLEQHGGALVGTYMAMPGHRPPFEPTPHTCPLCHGPMRVCAARTVEGTPLLFRVQTVDVDEPALATGQADPMPPDRIAFLCSPCRQVYNITPEALAALEQPSR